MKAYVINLDKNFSRMKKIGSRLAELRIQYERFPAIYGKTLSEAEKKEYANRFAWWCLRGLQMRDGELGCALSHLGVYKKIIDASIDIAVILEDDAILFDCFPKVIRFLEKTVDVHAPIAVLLANHSGRDYTDFGLHKIDSSYFAEGYVITKVAAERILNTNYPVLCPADSWGYWKDKCGITLYQMSPAACDQQWEAEGYLSDITPNSNSVVSVEDMSLCGKVVWKIKRLVGLTIAGLLYR